MKKILLSLFLLITLGTTGFSELVKNGDFSDKIKYWRLGQNQHYGRETTAEIEDGSLVLGNLLNTTMHYFSLTQAIDIVEGKKYKLSFEVSGDKDNLLAIAVGDTSHKVFGKRIKLDGSTKQVLEFPFTADYTSDTKYSKKWLSLARKSKFDGGRSTHEKFHEIKKSKNIDVPSECMLYFGLGGLDNSFSISNISIVEVK